MTHADYEVLVIVGHDDPETAAVARGLAEGEARRSQGDHRQDERKNKPKALNTALPTASATW